MGWLAFAQEEPFGEFRADIRTGIIASTLANVHRGKDTKPFSIEDFMPFYQPEKPQIQKPPNGWALFSE